MLHLDSVLGYQRLGFVCGLVQFIYGRSLFGGGICQKLACVCYVLGSGGNRHGNLDNLCKHKIVGLYKVIQISSQRVFIGANIDKHRHVAVGQAFYYLHVLMDAFYHSLEGVNHRADFVFFIAF